MKRKLISFWLCCALFAPMAMTMAATSEPVQAAKGDRPKPPKPGPREDGEDD
jgi:hypothetical protein